MTRSKDLIKNYRADRDINLRFLSTCPVCVQLLCERVTYKVADAGSIHQFLWHVVVFYSHEDRVDQDRQCNEQIEQGVWHQNEDLVLQSEPGDVEETASFQTVMVTVH